MSSENSTVQKKELLLQVTMPIRTLKPLRSPTINPSPNYVDMEFFCHVTFINISAISWLRFWFVWPLFYKVFGIWYQPILQMLKRSALFSQKVTIKFCSWKLLFPLLPFALFRRTFFTVCKTGKARRGKQKSLLSLHLLSPLLSPVKLLLLLEDQLLPPQQQMKEEFCTEKTCCPFSPLFLVGRVPTSEHEKLNLK